MIPDPFTFQSEGIDFLVQNKRSILGDEQGLGKTRQVIESLLRLQPPRVLIVTKPNLVRNWQDESVKWGVSTPFTIVEGDATFRSSILKPTDGVPRIIHYDLLRRHVEQFEKQKWDVVVFDEVHRLKNRQTASFKVAKKIARNSDRLMLLSGTPVWNGTQDLWTLLHMISPKQFSSYWRFVEEYCKISEWGGFKVVEDISDREDARLVKLRGILSTVMLRRTKEEVLPELPPKIVSKIWVDLGAKEAAAIQQLKKEFRYLSESGDQVLVTDVIALTMRFRQASLDPELIINSSPKTVSGAKVDMLLELIESLQGQHVVIFSQFAGLIRAVHQDLVHLKFRSSCVTRETVGQERLRIIENWRKWGGPLFVTYPIGSEGHTWTEASHCIILDKPWSPQTLSQAQDRLHRIGQTRSVNYYEILARKSFDEKIEKILDRKSAVSDAIIESDILDALLG